MENYLSADVNTMVAAHDKAIAKKLRGLRVRACINLDEFAEALGVETAELESYENGSENVPASVIAMVCAISGVPFEHFFNDENVENVTPMVGHVSVMEEQAVVFN